MRRFQCHKIVDAERVVGYSLETQSLHLMGGEVVDVGEECMLRIAKMAALASLSLMDGYYVIYDDSYKSWSPTKVFDDGYFEIPGDDDEAAVEDAVGG